jgi:hypothetical protein
MTFAILCFVGVELRNIHQDKSAADLKAKQDRIDEDNRFANLLKTQSDSFNEVLAQNQKSFDATMSRMEGLARMSKENVDSVTGGSDFIIIDIITSPVDKDGVSLVATTSGKHPIRDARYVMNEGRPPYLLSDTARNDILAGRTPPGVEVFQLGTVIPAQATPAGVKHPSLKKGAYYNINIFALNGSVNEKLEVRYVDAIRQWDRQLTVMRGNKIVRQSSWNNHR